jgi:hypothetical protein
MLGFIRKWRALRHARAAAFDPLPEVAQAAHEYRARLTRLLAAGGTAPNTAALASVTVERLDRELALRAQHAQWFTESPEARALHRQRVAECDGRVAALMTYTP